MKKSVFRNRKDLGDLQYVGQLGVSGSVWKDKDGVHWHDGCMVPERKLAKVNHCPTCGTPQPHDQVIACINCWEVESRITTYLRSKKGREYIEECLEEARKREEACS